MYIGMDIGYSGLKLVFGDQKSSCTKKTMPVGVIEDCSNNGLSVGNAAIPASVRKPLMPTF